MVTRVVDGDTIDVEVSGETVEVRLVAINAPDEGECYADRSRDHLIETLRDEPVEIQVTGEDRFGRTLAHVFAGDRHINVEMIELGLAFAVTPEAGDPFASEVLGAEDGAYFSRAGIWAEDACGPGGALPLVSIDPERSDIDPEGADDSRLEDETLAIHNTGPEAIDLSGWILRDESTRHRFTFGAGALLGPGERVIVASSDTGWDPGQSAVWNNQGDMALLQLLDGTVVSRWRY